MGIFLDINNFKNYINKRDLYIKKYSNNSVVLQKLLFNYKKFLSIDYGTRKVGLSISNEEKNIAFPKDILIGDWKQNNINDLIKILIQKIEEYKIFAVIIGLSINLNCEPNKNYNTIIKIAKKLQIELNINKKITNNDNDENENDYFKIDKNNQIERPILLFDERYTTKIANYNNKNKLDDNKSACILLNDVLNFINN